MTPPRVVLTPELFGRALGNGAAHAVLAAWRSERLVPVVNRPLLKRYLQVLRGLGLVEDMLLRGWVWVWTRHSGVHWEEEVPAEPALEGISGWQICLDLAAQSGATIVASAAAGPGLEKIGAPCIALSDLAVWLGTAEEA